MGVHKAGVDGSAAGVDHLFLQGIGRGHGADRGDFAVPHQQVAVRDRVACHRINHCILYQHVLPPKTGRRPEKSGLVCNFRSIGYFKSKANPKGTRTAWIPGIGTGLLLFFMEQTIVPIL